MEKDNIEDIYPLSPMQEGMIFHALYAPESRVYFEQDNYTIEGELDVSAMKRAWERVVERHPVLRTAFVLKRRDNPLQVVYRRLDLPWTYLDWRGIAASQQQNGLSDLLKADQEEGFDLSRAPIIRLTLIRMADQYYHFVWRFHHALMDRTSVSLVFKELFTIYKAIARGGNIQLKEPRPYREYISWLRRQDMSKAEAFWRKTLKDFTAPTPFAVDRPAGNSSDEKEDYKKESLKFSLAETAKLQSLARRHRLTLNTLVQGVWALLLSRYSGEQQVVFGTTMSGRPTDLAGAESMVGLFINTLVVRAQIEEDAPVLTWLRQLQAQQAEAYQYIFTPLVQVQGWSEVPRSKPLFESLLIFESRTRESDLQEPGADISIRRISSYEMPNFPLSLLAWPNQELMLDIWYDCRRFDRIAVKRMAGHIQTLMEGIASDPAQRLSQLPLLTSSERHRLLVEWNNTEINYPTDQWIHESFEAQAERTPDAVAVVFENDRLTYRELNEKANQLALYLRELGVGPDVPVGICMHRSLDMVISLLAILKAGGAYVPLDPQYPQHRMSFIIKDAGVRMVLTQHNVVATPDDYNYQLACLDTLWDEIASYSRHNLKTELFGENLAYIIYTSGSTGQPKGVMNRHRGISNRLEWMQQAYGLDGTDRVLQKTPYSFDVSVWEFFWPLMAGARLVVARPGGHQDSRYLVEVINKEQITTLHFVPSMLGVFLEEEGVGRCESLRRVISSGEALSRKLQERFFERLAGVELENLYGPTEAAVDVTSWRCERGSKREAVPIGAPITNIKMYVLDEEKEPVPVGVRGEIYISGEGLGRGYVGKADMTAERFLPDPHSGREGERMYRTGDAGRYLEDGSIEYIGRVDHQVKLRGYRIEPGEIESALVMHPGLQDAVVTIHESDSGSARLVAYVVPDADCAKAARRMLQLEKEGLLSEQPRLELQNGMVVFCVSNKEEAKFIYKEIFEEQVYLRHGITLHEGSCIFDVGANIGMFTLSAGLLCKDAVIYAFEPIQPIFEILRLNTELYGLNVRLYDCGLSSEEGTSVFTYYPQFPGSSGRFGDKQRDWEILKTGILNMLETDGNQQAQSDGELDEIIGQRLTERLTSEQVPCRLRKLSDVIRENGIDRIDLLKIDAERSELDVLVGIDDDDWQKIEQIVMEVDDTEFRLERITELLERNGFQVIVEQESWCKDTGLYNVYARRAFEDRSDREPDIETASIKPPFELPLAWSSPARLTGDVRRYLQERLPDYMVPSAFVMLNNLPLTPNGKVNRKNLPALDLARSKVGPSFVAPRTPVEREVAEIWRDLLGAEQVGIYDTFFELGGHSLLLTQLATRIKKSFQVELPLQTLFNAPTIVDMTRAIAAAQVESEDLTETAQLIEELKQLSSDEIKAMLEAESGELV